MSTQTRSCKRAARIFGLLSFLATVFPVLFYAVRALINGEVGTKQKATLGLMLIIALILLIVNVLMKYSMRSTVWILILGVYICLQDILPLILMIAIGTILDEFIFTPCKKSFANKYVINKELDKRCQKEN